MIRALAVVMLLPATVASASGVGKNWGVERTSYVDPTTGVRVWELTSAGSAADNLYFHFSNFTADNKYVLIVSDRTGSAQLYRVSVESGEIVQLTDDTAAAARNACPDPKRPDIVYYMRGPDVIELNIETFGERRIGSIPKPYLGGFQQPTVSHDGKWLTMSKQVDSANWEVGLINISSGEYRTLVRQGFRITHVQHSPKDPVTFYVWETGGFAPQRSWVVNDDGTANRPLYAPVDSKKWITPLKEWMTHEAWVPETGDMTMINDKVGIMLVKPDGTAKLIREGRYWHCAARPDGKYLTVDDAQGRIWLTETATGNIRLLATGTRDTLPVHGHTSFDRKGRYIQFHTGRKHETVAIIDLNTLPDLAWR